MELRAIDIEAGWDMAAYAYEITLAGGTVRYVMATAAGVSPNGDLLLTDGAGLVQAFARGSWTQCKRQDK